MHFSISFHFLRVYYGISMQNERVPSSQIKFEIIGDRVRIFVDIY